MRTSSRWLKRFGHINAPSRLSSSTAAAVSRGSREHSQMCCDHPWLSHLQGKIALRTSIVNPKKMLWEL